VCFTVIVCTVLCFIRERSIISDLSDKVLWMCYTNLIKARRINRLAVQRR